MACVCVHLTKNCFLLAKIDDFIYLIACCVFYQMWQHRVWTGCIMTDISRAAKCHTEGSRVLELNLSQFMCHVEYRPASAYQRHELHCHLKTPYILSCQDEANSRHKYFWISPRTFLWHWICQCHELLLSKTRNGRYQMFVHDKTMTGNIPN